MVECTSGGMYQMNDGWNPGGELEVLYLRMANGTKTVAVDTYLEIAGG
jgi:hypothetical protein